MDVTILILVVSVFYAALCLEVPNVPLVATARLSQSHISTTDKNVEILPDSTMEIDESTNKDSPSDELFGGLRSQERLHSLEILKDSAPVMEHGDALSFFIWRGDVFCVTALRSGTAISTVSFSDRGILFDEVQKLPSTSYLEKADMLEVILTGRVLWVFTASYVSNSLLVTKVRIGLGKIESTIRQIIPMQRPISGIRPFVSSDKELFLVVSLKYDFNLVTGEPGVSELYKMKEGIFEKNLTFQYSSKSNYTKISSFSHEDMVYINLVESSAGGSGYRFDPQNSTMKSVYEFDQRTLSVVAVEAASTTYKRQFLLLLRGANESSLVLLLKGEGFVPWKKLDEGSIEGFGLAASLSKNNFLIVANKGTISVFKEPEQFGLSQKQDFRSPCGGNILGFNYLILENRILLNLVCSTGRTGSVTTRYVLLESSVTNEESFQKDSPTVSPSVSAVEKCLDELEITLMRNRPLIRDLAGILEKKLLISPHLDNVLEQPTHFKNLQSMSLDAKDVLESPPELLDGLLLRINQLEERIGAFNTKIKSIEADLPSLLTYSKDQHITASVKINKLTANSSNIFAIDVEQLNEIPIQDYKTKFLRLEDDQEITTNIVLDKVITKRLQTQLLSNNVIKIKPKELLDSKSPNQIITGQHSFSSLEVVNNMDRVKSAQPLVINGIGSNELVTSAEDVTLAGKKIFTNTLKVIHSINMSSLNEVDYDSWHNSLLRLDKDSKVSVPGSMFVQGNVEVKGNLKVLSVDGIDIQQFSEQVAKKSNRHQMIDGPVEFVPALSLRNLQVKDVNDINWGDYLRVANSSVHAKFYIDEAVVIGNLISDSINGVDLDKEAVLTDTDQVIEGLIKFGTSVNVTGPKGVSMGIGATINGIDPSLRIPFGTGLQHQVINKEINIGHAFEFKGDVQISYINGEPFPDLENGFWRKSVSQKIPGDVTIDRINFQKSVYAQTFNGLKSDDYLQTDVDDQTLSGRNYFTKEVTILNNIDLKDGKLFDGVLLPELRDQAVRLDGRQTIIGPVVFDSGLEIKNLVVKDGFLKDIDIETDLVYGNSSLYLDEATFTDWVTAESLTVLGLLNVRSINEKRASSILKPKLTPLSEIDGSLFLDDLEVKDLTVAGQICGIDFNSWIKRTISKEAFSSQSFLKNVTIDGSVSFEGPLELEIVNNKSWDDHLEQIAQTCEGCKMGATKTFIKALDVLGNVTAEFINGVNLEMLRTRILSRSEPQIVTGQYTFEKGVSAVEVEVPEISTFPIEDLILIDQPTTLKGATVFASGVKFDEVSAPHSWLDGCNLDAALNPPEIEPGNLVLSDIFLGHLRVRGNVSIDGNVYSGRDNIHLFSFLERVARRSADQDITGETNFEGTTYVRNLKAIYFNKIMLETVFEKLNKKLTDVSLNCDVKFLDPITIRNMTVRNVNPESRDFTVNNLRILDILDSAVKRGSTETIHGTKTINNLVVERNLILDRLNRIPFDQLVKIEDKHYGKKLKFLGPLFIEGDINVKGLVDQMEPEEIFRPFESTEEATIFPAKYNLIEIKGDLIVDSINGLPFSDLVTNRMKSQEITGLKTFLGGLFIEGQVNIEVLNEIDLNQFGRWNEFQSRTFPEKILESHFEYPDDSDQSSLTRRNYLENMAFMLRRFNDFNFRDAKTLHQELLFLSEKSRVTIQGVVVLLPYQPFFSRKIKALTGSDGSCTEDGIATHNLKINLENGLLEDTPYFDGLHIVIYIPEVKKQIYDFITPCGNVLLQETSIRRLDFKEQILNYKPLKLGVIKKVDHFIANSKVYFVILSTTSYKNVNDVKYSLSVLKAEDDLKVVWRKNLFIKAKDFDLHEINNYWTLVVGGNYLQHSYSAGFQSESNIYHWNKKYEKFEVIGHLEPASSVEFLNYRQDCLLILGQSREEFNQLNIGRRERNIKVYKKVSNSTNFVPYKSVPMTDVSDTASFIAGSDLFIAATSKKEGSLRIFKIVDMEEFKEVQSFAVESPTSVLYVAEGGKHFLLVSSNSYVRLLELHFEGVDGNLVKDPYA